MNFFQVLLILKARYKVIVITFALVFFAGAGATYVWPKSYEATASVLMNYKGVDPVTGLTLPALLMPGYMPTQSEIIKSQKVAAAVVEKLGLAKSPAAIAQFQEATGGKGDINIWLGQVLVKNLDVSPSKDSSIIEISFTGTEPVFAATMANAFADAYVEANLKFKVEPAQKASEFFEEKIKSYRANLVAAQTALSQYQQDKGITNIDNRLDVESARLSELSAQLSSAQSMTIDAQTRQYNASKNSLTSPDVAQNPVVQGLQMDISRSETKLVELSQRLGSNHPQYKSAEEELKKLRSQLSLELGRATAIVSGTSRISREREQELRVQVEIQKKKVLELNKMWAELSVLRKDVESAEMALNSAMQRLSQTSIESQANQTDISVLNAAEPPLAPNRPKTLLNLLISVFLGSFLGISLGFLAELMDRRVRSKEDLSELLEVPVFAVIKKEPKRLVARFSTKTPKLLAS